MLQKLDKFLGPHTSKLASDIGEQYSKRTSRSDITQKNIVITLNIGYNFEIVTPEFVVFLVKFHNVVKDFVLLFFLKIFTIISYSSTDFSFGFFFFLKREDLMYYYI